MCGRYAASRHQDQLVEVFEVDVEVFEADEDVDVPGPPLTRALQSMGNS